VRPTSRRNWAVEAVLDAPSTPVPPAVLMAMLAC
jgi:hypothetical protein